MKPLLRMIVPVGITAAAAAWWIVTVVVVPASIRASIEEDLGPYFPGGIRFECPRKLGKGRYAIRNFRAFASGNSEPWLTAAGVELTLTDDGIGLDTVLLGAPQVRLEEGPDFLPPGAFRIPPGKKTLPRVEAVRGVLMGPLPGAQGLRIAWASDFQLHFRPEEGFNTRGSFTTPIGPFTMFGNINPGGRSHLRAKAESIDFASVAGLLQDAGPLRLHDRGGGAFTFAFGGGSPPVLAGSLSLGEVALDGAGIRFHGARLLVRSAAGREKAWNPTLRLLASGATWGSVRVENVDLTMSPGGGRAAHGRGLLWGGELEVQGGMNPVFWGWGVLRGADMSLMAPGLLGAATPASGELDVKFNLSGGRLDGDFRATNATLWSVPFLSGIRQVVPGFRRGSEVFEEVKGRFRHEGEITLLPALALTGSGFRLTLNRPGRVGPRGLVDLEFDLQLHRRRKEGGLPPLRTLVEALSRELWKPFAKFIQFRIRVRGTLDHPIHQLLPPQVFGK
ncbi:MAG: hypothetical protein ACYS47_03845 [Planctomycetota bacterium]|jgi:hypothetical protein